MAQIFPLEGAIKRDPAAARLDATLAGLPEAWTILRQRRIGGRDGAMAGYILLHPEIGIALLDLLPAQPGSAVAALEELMRRQRFGSFYPGALPIVAVAIGQDEIPAVGQRLESAFETAPFCDIADASWTDAVVELLMTAEDTDQTPPLPAARPPARPAAPIQIARPAPAALRDPTVQPPIRVVPMTRTEQTAPAESLPRAEPTAQAKPPPSGPMASPELRYWDEKPPRRPGRAMRIAVLIVILAAGAVGAGAYMLSPGAGDRYAGTPARSPGNPGTASQAASAVQPSPAPLASAKEPAPVPETAQSGTDPVAAEPRSDIASAPLAPAAPASSTSQPGSASFTPPPPLQPAAPPPATATAAPAPPLPGEKPIYREIPSAGSSFAAVPVRPAAKPRPPAPLRDASAVFKPPVDTFRRKDARRPDTAAPRDNPDLPPLDASDLPPLDGPAKPPHTSEADQPASPPRPNAAAANAPLSLPSPSYSTHAVAADGPPVPLVRAQPRSYPPVSYPLVAPKTARPADDSEPPLAGATPALQTQAKNQSGALGPPLSLLPPSGGSGRSMPPAQSIDSSPD